MKPKKPGWYPYWDGYVWEPKLVREMDTGRMGFPGKFIDETKDEQWGDEVVMPVKKTSPYIAPCPFCGISGETNVFTIPYGSLTAVYCRECKAIGPKAHIEDAAIIIWNMAKR